MHKKEISINPLDNNKIKERWWVETLSNEFAHCNWYLQDNLYNDQFLHKYVWYHTFIIFETWKITFHEEVEVHMSLLIDDQINQNKGINLYKQGRQTQTTCHSQTMN